MDKPADVDEYIERFDEPRAARLRAIRALCLDAAPGADETLKWGAPAYVDDTILFQFAGYRAHTNIVVTPSAKESLEGGFEGYETGKGSLKVPFDSPLPTDLIRRLLVRRTREFAEEGVRWM